MLKYDILATANNYRWDKPLYELSAEQSGCLQLLSSCLDFYTWKIFLDAQCLFLFLADRVTVHSASHCLGPKCQFCRHALSKT